MPWFLPNACKKQFYGLEINYIDDNITSAGGARVGIGYAGGGTDADTVGKGNPRGKVDVGASAGR
jgi:hypothetical protein